VRRGQHCCLRIVVIVVEGQGAARRAAVALAAVAGDAGVHDRLVRRDGRVTRERSGDRRVAHRAG